MITLRTEDDKLIDCHILQKVTHNRWYNVGFSYDSNGFLKAYLNGIEIRTSCTDSYGKVRIYNCILLLCDPCNIQNSNIDLFERWI